MPPQPAWTDATEARAARALPRLRSTAAAAAAPKRRDARGRAGSERSFPSAAR